jgi:hypothetical protein
MQYVKYNRINTEEFPNDYQWPWAIVIDAWWEFTPTGWFTADKTLFWIFWDDDFDKIPSEYSPSQYTPQWVVDEMNWLYWDYYSLDTDDFTILSIRPIN